MRAYKIDGEIKSLEDEKNGIYERITGMAYKEVQVMSSPKNASDELYDILDEYTKKIEAKKICLLKIKSEIFEAISKIQNPVYRQLLTLRYLRYERWEAIAEEMHYDFDYVRRKLHARALDSVPYNVH